MRAFDKENRNLTVQFENIAWIKESGMDEIELNHTYDELMKKDKVFPKSILKAKTFELIATKSRIALDKDDIFQDKLFGGGLMLRQRDEWEHAIQEEFLSEEYKEICKAWDIFGAYRGQSDFGHTSPNSQLLVNVGFTGLLERVKNESQRAGLTQKQRDFYESCKIVLSSIIKFLNRLADAIYLYNEENGRALRNIANDAPGNIYEAMQLIIVYFFLHEYVAGTRVRTLGRLDALLYPFYKKDIESGLFSKAEIKEMLKFFLNKFWSAKVPYDLPFCLGGIDSDGVEVTNEISYLIVETYNELGIHSPKIHIRVSDKTPEAFVELVLRCIRGGNSSFVFVNDNVGIKSLMNVGISEKDARNYVPIGCYEPAVWGAEIGCTGNGGVNLAKAVELVITGGVDLNSGELAGIQTGKIDSYEQFLDAIKAQIRFMTQKAMDYIVKVEKYYGEIHPDAILSSMYAESVSRGVDVFEGGAKYNNSSLSFYSIASLVDSVDVVKRLIFDEKRISFDELCIALKANWEGYENLRKVAKNIPEKYGNGNATADALTEYFADFCAEITNNKPNGRGGVFKASCFSIDHCFELGEKTMATPDGRLSGEPLSKNLCATTGMDKLGITALINSVTKIDHSKFPNGSVLDIVLHPSAVQGDDGIDAFLALLKTYMKKGGFAIHGNVFNPEDLKAAQRNPEKYSTLQVRVCGWNAYFVNLSRAEQDAFIRQAENAG